METELTNKNPVLWNFLTKKKTVIIFSLKIIIACGLVYYLISNIEYKQIVAALQNANLVLIILTFCLSSLNIYLQFAKWKLTSRQVLAEDSNSRLILSLFYGYAAGIITPLRIGEYFGRAIAFRNKPIVQVTVATLIDKFFPLIIVALLGSVSCLIFIYFYSGVSIYIVLSLFILLFTFFYFFTLLIINQRFWDNFLFNRLRSSARLSGVLENLKVLRSLDRNYVIKMIIFSFLFYLCFIVQYVLLVTAFAHNYNYIEYFWAANLIMFVKTLIPPVSLGELGIREGVSVYFLTQLGESSAIAFNASILLFVINLLIPAFIGVILLFRRNDN